ncbi:MAG: hypothetical protein ACKPKO_30475, partial [Candidatus Fonsibacter sp.]
REIALYIYKKRSHTFQPEHSEGRYRQHIMSYMISKSENNIIQRTPMQMLQICKGIDMYQIARGGKVMEFKNYKNMLERPFYVSTDSECSLIETGDANKVAKHLVNSTCFYLVCTYDNSKNRLWTCVGEDSMTNMIIELSAVADDCIEEMRKNQVNEMTEEDQLDFENATCCSICKQEFTEK